MMSEHGTAGDCVGMPQDNLLGCQRDVFMSYQYHLLTKRDQQQSLLKQSWNFHNSSSHQRPLLLSSSTLYSLTFKQERFEIFPTFQMSVHLFLRCSQCCMLYVPPPS